MRLLLTSSLCLLMALSGLNAQKLDHRLGYILVQVEKGTSLENLLASHSSRIRGAILPDRPISNRLGIHLVRFDHALIHEGKLLQQLRADRKVLVAQFDHLTTLRVIPDDPQLSSQWQWLNTGQTGGLLDADIDADRAWDITTGGLTATGDTIVVAIVDGGMDFSHEDIAANTWINYDEIDGNGVDDDGNGYIDDIYGWNAYDDDADVFGQGHGLNVAGMVGAVGNNGIGVTGINWNVKLMTIVGGSPESSAIASYAYALDQRILYNETDGEKGAFVVATNSSWGIDFGQPADAPLWCAFYDSLGAHGILSAAATANLNIDIDIESDLPTGCPSEYLLSVTALNHNNDRTFSAYGLTQIDFGAPGEDIFTTFRNNGYDHTSGTSFASPVTAGLVALLYSTPCQAFADFIHSNPAGAAQFVRNMIFQGVEPISSLEDFTKYGGGLNAGNSVELLLSVCSECPVPFSVAADVLSDTEVFISWNMLDTADAVNARIRPLGEITWDTLADISQPLHLTELVGCTEYEIEFESICADTSTGYTSNFVFKTDGCCDLPAEILTSTGDDFIRVSWNDVLAALYYQLEWRPEGSEEWIEEATPDTDFVINDLTPCTYYEIRIQTNCDTSATGYSDTLRVRTTGCGNCIDLPYCQAAGGDATEEHIDSLIIGPLVNHSGPNNGYFFFEDLNPVYAAGDAYEVELRPGFSTGSTFDEQFRIWLDVNQDGVFDETELLLDSVLSEDDTKLISQITIPDFALRGSTRMRVSMAFVPFFPPDHEACESFDFGEVEDYCVEIVRNPDPCMPVDTLQFDAITTNSAFMYWPDVEGAIAYTYRWRETGTIDYEELATDDTTANITGLEECKSYEMQIRTVCLTDTTSYNFNYILETDCVNAVKEETPLLASMHVFPNPAVDFFMIRLQALGAGDHHISIFNLQGQRIKSTIQYAEPDEITEIQMDGLRSYPPGLYFVVVEKDGLVATRKVVKL